VLQQFLFYVTFPGVGIMQITRLSSRTTRDGS